MVSSERDEVRLSPFSTETIALSIGKAAPRSMNRRHSLIGSIPGDLRLDPLECLDLLDRADDAEPNHVRVGQPPDALRNVGIGPDPLRIGRIPRATPALLGDLHPRAAAGHARILLLRR